MVIGVEVLDRALALSAWLWVGLASIAIHTDGTWGASKYIMESTNLVGALKCLHLGRVRGLPQRECRGQRITCRNFLFFYHVGSRDQV